jgi:hypothetical protein
VPATHIGVSGLALLPLGPADGHALLVHHGAPERAQALMRWTARGIGHHERVLFEAMDDADTAALAATASALAAEAVPGQVEVLAAGTVTTPELLVTHVENALASGYRGLRLAGTHPKLLEGLSAEQYARHESELERLSVLLPVSCVCAVDADRVPEAVVIRALHHHRRAGGADFRIEVEPPELRAAGALTGSAEGIVRAGLALAAARQREVVVDLTAVSVLAPPGIRGLLEGTAALRDAGGVVALRTAAAARVVLEALRLDSEAGFVMQAERGTRELS